ncbi:AMP-binding protein [Schaalia hyovaginalis]|uniref:AMP-binding protein n=2 Tax=Schaalia hyovaginalis TaxID=29316 RepID=UPI0023F7FA39|nr:AMP-binding protein [Schaalia hyovaginalis]MCI7671207.1 AMP-binding protein [Schaalia hyovaginalis]
MTLTDDLRRGYAPGVAHTIDIPDTTLPRMVEEVAARYPERVALDFFSRPITYSQLIERVQRAAAVLIRAGVAKGDRVGLVMPNCPQHVIAILATMSIGAIAVEHNPLAPLGELREEFARHGARVVIAWEKTVPSLSFLDRSTTVFSVDITRALPGPAQVLLRLPVKSARTKRDALSARPPRWARSWDREVAQSPRWLRRVEVSPDDDALLIHTGGTTGVPKAARLTHRSILANVAQSIAWVPVLHEGAEVFYCVLPLFHAFGFTVGLMAGLRLGATVALFPKFDTTMILTSQKRLPCTFFLGVPPMYERLLASAKALGADLSSMTFSLSGAMPLSGELAAEWEAATSGLMIEGYGMTEASPILLGSPLSADRRPGALGLPFPSTEIRIVDPEDPDREVETGGIGELLVRGPQVFAGYWMRPDETQEVFHKGWLRTGDLVTVRDGFVYMADRRKEMINSSGFNVYPSQVEEAVRSMPGVRDVAVIGIPAGTAGEDVVAAIVLEAGASITLADVREWAEKSLAHYALPRQLVIMTELPRSQLGKVMRKKVREQVLGAASSVKDAAENAAQALRNVAGRNGE